MASIAESTTILESPELLPSFTFAEAAPIWYEKHSRRISPGTMRHYTNCINRLMPFFGHLPLGQIRASHFEQYQKLRRLGEGGLHAAGRSSITSSTRFRRSCAARANLRKPQACRTFAVTISGTM